MSNWCSTTNVCTVHTSHSYANISTCIHHNGNTLNVWRSFISMRLCYFVLIFPSSSPSCDYGEIWFKRTANAETWFYATATCDKNGIKESYTQTHTPNSHSHLICIYTKDIYFERQNMHWMTCTHLFFLNLFFFVVDFNRFSKFVCFWLSSLNHSMQMSIIFHIWNKQTNISAFEQLARALLGTIETRNISIECRNSSTLW